MTTRTPTTRTPTTRTPTPRTPTPRTPTTLTTRPTRVAVKTHAADIDTAARLTGHVLGSFALFYSTLQWARYRRLRLRSTPPPPTPTKKEKTSSPPPEK